MELYMIIIAGFLQNTAIESMCVFVSLFLHHN